MIHSLKKLRGVIFGGINFRKNIDQGDKLNLFVGIIIPKFAMSSIISARLFQQSFFRPMRCRPEKLEKSRMHLLIVYIADCLSMPRVHKCCLCLINYTWKVIIKTIQPLLLRIKVKKQILSFWLQLRIKLFIIHNSCSLTLNHLTNLSRNRVFLYNSN